MSFNSADYISERIRVTNSYKEAVSLRDQVWSISGKIELKQFVDLRDRVEKKIKEFDRPIFEDAKVNVKFPDGRITSVDSREINIVVGKGIGLSEYVFREFPDASDFEVIYAGFEDPLEKILGKDADDSRLELGANRDFKGGMIREAVERIVKLALKLVNFLFSTYSRAFPDIAEDLRIIKDRIEELFEKISTTYF
ncbi:hypothetical protein IX51_10810 [uncultured archaeon]|nr:hypothetical protein IX51_10810 [uncultured archaeon]